jgi:alkylated DNA repair protein (DNA oxidative demethylase)
VKPLAASVDTLARAAVADAYGAGSTEACTFRPDAAIVNFYPDAARLGLHQDGEEPSDAPVVTISLGDTCTFRLAGVDRRVGPFLDLELRSGDLLVFGREQRRVFHGVPRVVAGTAPAGLGLPPGRLSVTVRETGFT